MDEQGLKDWYTEAIPKYVRLTNVVKSELENAFNSRRLVVANVDSRVKDIESVLEKSRKRKEGNALKYQNPKTEIMDYAGVRVIAYMRSDIEYICKIITDLFQTDKRHFTDKAEGLGTDKIGYLSVHHIVSLKKGVAGKTDYDELKALKCEVQVKTILQHAWAQSFHDRQYKRKGTKVDENTRVPKALARKTNLIAGSLELMDENIENLAHEYDRWLGNPDNVHYQQLLDRELDKDSLVLYIQSKLGVKDGIKIINSTRVDNVLNSFQVENIRQLDAYVFPAFIKAIKEAMGRRITVDRFIDCLFIYDDYKKYFEENGGYVSKYISDESCQVLNKLGFLVDDMCAEYAISRRVTW